MMIEASKAVTLQSQGLLGVVQHMCKATPMLCAQAGRHICRHGWPHLSIVEVLLCH